MNYPLLTLDSYGVDKSWYETKKNTERCATLNSFNNLKPFFSKFHHNLHFLNFLCSSHGVKILSLEIITLKASTKLEQFV